MQQDGTPADTGTRYRGKRRSNKDTSAQGAGKHKGKNGQAHLSHSKSNGAVTKNGDVSYEQYVQTSWDDFRALMQCLWSLIGLACMIGVGYAFSWYMRTLHDNQLWFSNIGQLEQEISLRTECGLYYSYYKQIIESADFESGLYALTQDNATEHGRTINILERFNVYQEVILAGLYHRFRPALSPMLFYVYSIFHLNGFYVSTVFAVAWYLSGNWLAGLLAAVYMTTGLDDATRVFFTVNLRESFALPFLLVQVYFIMVWLERSPPRHYITKVFIVAGAFTSSVLFAVCWQFNQFIFLLESIAIFALATMRVAPMHKTQQILACLFCQPMLLGAAVISFIPSALFVLYVCRRATISGGIVTGFFKLLFQAIFVLLLTGLLNWLIKSVVQLDADAHIYKFVRGKMGGSVPIDFEARIYICHGAFSFLENAFFWRTTTNCLFPLYMLIISGVLFLLCRDMILEWCAVILHHRGAAPDATTGIANANGPTMSNSLTPASVHQHRMHNDEDDTVEIITYMPLDPTDASGIWNELCESACTRPKLARSTSRVIRHIVPVLLCSYLLYSYYPTYTELMDDLKEFWDPDTVELMKWINKETPENASFAGSMQLLAGVKACTGRHLINHPHFEDRWLRERTKRVYQMYGRRAPKEVYDLLRAEDTHYIIIEDSICLAQSDGCRTPDLIDMDNGQIPDNGYDAQQTLQQTNAKRFCDQIRHGEREYAKYFKLVMQNRTFRVYQLLKSKEDTGKKE